MERSLGLVDFLLYVNGDLLLKRVRPTIFDNSTSSICKRLDNFSKLVILWRQPRSGNRYFLPRKIWPTVMPPANAEVKGKIIIDSTIRKNVLFSLFPLIVYCYSELKLLHSVTNYRNYFTSIFILENRTYI